jgi:hypothetical protein
MTDKLTEFFRQAAFYRYHPKFQRRERDYKLRLASGFSQSRDLLNSKPRVALELLRKTFTSKDNNIVDWRNRADVVAWIKERPTDAALSLRKLWKSTAALEKRFDSFCEDLAEAGVTASGAQLAIISTLLMTHSACKFPPVKVQAFRPALKTLDWDDLVTKDGALDRYLYAQMFLDYLIEQGEEFDVELRDRLDAQGIVWCIGGGWSDTSVPRSWKNNPEQRAKADLEFYQGDLIELEAEAGANRRTPTEKLALVKARRGQGRFRDGLIELWGCCAVSDCRELNLLRASHIMPWKIGNDKQRLDKFNGLLLSPNLDAAFDAGLITFAEDGKILISKSLGNEDRRALGIQNHFRLRRIARQHLPYLAYHRRNVFEKKIGMGWS